MPDATEQARTCSQCGSCVEAGNEAYVIHKVIIPHNMANPVKVQGSEKLICQECWH